MRPRRKFITGGRPPVVVPEPVYVNTLHIETLRYPDGSWNILYGKGPTEVMGHLTALTEMGLALYLGQALGDFLKVHGVPDSYCLRCLMKRRAWPGEVPRPLTEAHETLINRIGKPAVTYPQYSPINYLFDGD